MTASYDDMEYITLFDKPKAYMEYTLNDASLFVYASHQRYYLDTESSILLTVESLQRSAYIEILHADLPSKCISPYTFHDALLSIFCLPRIVSREFAFAISAYILVCVFFVFRDFYNTKSYNLLYPYTALDLINSGIGEEPNSSFAYLVTIGGVF